MNKFTVSAPSVPLWFLSRGAMRVVCIAATSTLGCASVSKPSVIERDSPPPNYSVVAARHNERVNRLSRIWARAVVELEYLDEKERRRREQGEGHLQIRRPGGVALDVGKLGQTYLWLGADDQRYWLFDLQDERELFVGRHENIGKACNRPLGLPAHPLEMVALLGVTPMSMEAGMTTGETPVPPKKAMTDGASVAPEKSAERGTTAWSRDGRWIVVERSLRRGCERMFFDPQSFVPTRIELYPPTDADEPEVVAELHDYEQVTLRGVPGYFPMIASRVLIRHPESQTQITLHLSAMNDGMSRNRLSDEVFDLPSLMEAFSPTQVTALDRDCEYPALPAAELAGVGQADR